MAHLVLVDKPQDASSHLTGKRITRQVKNWRGEGAGREKIRVNQRAQGSRGRQGLTCHRRRAPQGPTGRVWGARWYPPAPAWRDEPCEAATLLTSQPRGTGLRRDRVAGWGRARLALGGGEGTGAKARGKWGGRCGAPGTLQRRPRRRLPSLGRPGIQTLGSTAGLCFTETPEAGPGRGLTLYCLCDSF